MTEMMPAAATSKNAAGNFQLVLERLLPAPPERVFDAFIDPATLTLWWGPEGYSCPEVSLDVTEGGDWRTLMQSPEGEKFAVLGRYSEIDRPARLVFTWAWQNDDGTVGHESEVEISFRPAGEGTHMHLIHRRLDSGESRDSHREGWVSSLNDLEQLLA